MNSAQIQALCSKVFGQSTFDPELWIRDFKKLSVLIYRHRVQFADEAYVRIGGFLYFDIIDYVGLGFYLFMSRVFQPRFVAPELPQHHHRVNEIAAMLQVSGGNDDEFADCDYAGVYVLRRRTE